MFHIYSTPFISPTVVLLLGSRYYVQFAQEEECSPERGTANAASESLKTKLVQMMEEADLS